MTAPKKQKSVELKPMTAAEFLDRFHKSVADIKAGRVLSHEQVKHQFMLKTAKNK